MDLSNFLPHSEDPSPNPRAVLFKNKGGSSRQLRDRLSLKNQRNDTRRLNMERLRGIHSIAEEEEEEQSVEEQGEHTKKEEEVKRRNAPRRRRGRPNLKDEQEKILKRLEEFKERKKCQREEEARGKKPAFKVGLVHHKPFSFENASRKENKKKNIFCLKENSPQNRQESERNMDEQEEDKAEAPKTPEKTTSTEEKDAPTTSPVLFKTPLQPVRRSRRQSTVSPLLDGLRTDICFSRGSSGDTRRAKKGLSPKMTSPLHSLIKEIDCEDVLKRKSLFAAAQEDEKEKPSIATLSELPDVSPFRALYSESVGKLTSFADAWEMEEAPSSEELKGTISAVVGKARLLMGKKGRLDQFKCLVDNCEFRLGEKETHTEDLRGFWDMIVVQIEGIYEEFGELSKLKARGWNKEEEEKPTTSKEQIKPIMKKKPKKAVAASSGLRAMLKEKRSLMNKNTTTTLEVEEEKPSISFDGGFFKVSSPIRLTISSPKVISGPSTPRRGVTPEYSSSYLRKSLLMSSVMRVSSSARRSLSTPMNEGQEEVPSSPLSTKKRSSRRLTSLFGEAAEEGEDLILFDTPQSTPRRSKRLSCKMTPVSYKN